MIPTNIAVLRQKVIKLFLNCYINDKELQEDLLYKDLVNNRGLLTLAIDFERQLLRKHKKTDDRYKEDFRERLGNLKDKKHPELKKRVLMKSLSVEKFVMCKIEDLAS